MSLKYEPASEPLHIRGVRYRGTSLIRNRTPLGLYSRPMHRVLRCDFAVGSSAPTSGCLGSQKRQQEHYSSAH